MVDTHQSYQPNGSRPGRRVPAMEPTLGPGAYSAAHESITKSDPGKKRHARTPPGQPVHTYYLPAQDLEERAVPRIGAAARGLLERYGGDPASLAEAIDMSPQEVQSVYVRLEDRLGRRPIEDLRIDFEDGYGQHPDEAEDAIAAEVGELLGRAGTAGELPDSVGIRIKALTPELSERGLRTLDLVLTAALKTGVSPSDFVVTLPKVESATQSRVLHEFLTQLESALGIDNGTVATEIMIESSPGLIDADGNVTVRALAEAAGARLRAVHFGVYDYTTSIGISANHQSLIHESADFARNIMQVELAGTGIWMSDGGTNVVPQGDHPEEGIKKEQLEENRRKVHDGWRTHFRHVTHSLTHGIYQGWDVHAGQLITRYAANFLFYDRGLPEAVSRLSRYLGNQGDGGVVDEPATASSLLSFVNRAVACGAAEATDIAPRLGIEAELLDGRALEELE